MDGVSCVPRALIQLSIALRESQTGIVLGVIAAAFINGLAVLLSAYRPPGWERWAWVVFAFGFLCALSLGVYLAWSILRPKHT